ncbi:hypothetical protein CC86DRAFT_427510 [Ophiobolus disseminans]|uniref:Retrotransposon gag domain-containing protein n=1 Tax=Ophiobolus disseminans TaxID=1469910 RepID=A0A6A6ZJQ5_9PLEO|nr:hypothetical protein CC86DRAFT_427510 [Ophiobolus disseminans]
MATGNFRSSSAGPATTVGLLESPSDWIKWSRQMEDWLGYNGYGLLLLGAAEDTGPKTRDNESTKDKVVRLELWEDKQSRGVWAIRSCCGQNARDEMQKETTITAAWRKLEARFRPAGSAIFQQLNFKYRNITLDQCNNSISKYAEQLKAARNNIEALDKSARISKPHFVDQFLTGLGEEYTAFLLTFHQTHNLLPTKVAGKPDIPPVTFDEAVMAAERHEQGLKVATRSEGVALLSRMTSPSLRGPCSFCNNARHHDSKCFGKHPYLRKA